MHHYGISQSVYRMDEVALHDVGDVASLLFCGTTEELEVLYIVSSILGPALIAVVPLITKTYGLDTVCYVNLQPSIGYLEKVALWDGPAIFILLGASAAMMAMVIILTRRACRRLMYE